MKQSIYVWIIAGVLACYGVAAHAVKKHTEVTVVEIGTEGSLNSSSGQVENTLFLSVRETAHNVDVGWTAGLTCSGYGNGVSILETGVGDLDNEATKMTMGVLLAAKLSGTPLILAYDEDESSNACLLIGATLGSGPAF